MGRIWASLLLAFCLACSQQGALLHELRHYAPHAGAAHGDEAESHAPGTGCQVCFAFQHIAGAVAAGLVLLALASTAEHWSLTERFALRAGDVPPARARDPPAAFRTVLHSLPRSPCSKARFVFRVQKDLPCSSPFSAA